MSGRKAQLFTLLTVSIVSLILSLSVVSRVYANTSDASCNDEVDLQGSVSKNAATVINYATNPDCSYDATLAVYDSPLAPNSYGWIAAQTLIGSKSVTVAPG